MNAGGNTAENQRYLAGHKDLRDSSLQAYFSEVRRWMRGHELNSTPLDFCRALYDSALGLSSSGSEETSAMQSALRALEDNERDYAVATTYALLMDQQVRQRLGVFFTPPALVRHLLQAMVSHGLDIREHRIADPAAGGAAFVVPLARLVLLHSRGLPNHLRLEQLTNRLAGIEIDPGLGKLANHLLSRIVAAELGETRGFARILRGRRRLVRTANALQYTPEEPFDAIIGNPPYGRLTADEFATWRELYPEIARDGHLNWFAIFVRRSLDLLKPQGLLGFVLPTSFIGSPSYTGFRETVVQIADILRIDHIDQRKGLFQSVQQDCCFLVLRKRSSRPLRRPACRLGFLSSGGDYRTDGSFSPRADGSPWLMSSGKPSDESALSKDQSECTTLSDLGWRGSVGPIVPHRHQSIMLRKRPAAIPLDQVVVPLIWSKAITPDGHFDPERNRQCSEYTLVKCARNHPSLLRGPAILVQRTSNKQQRRRINTAILPSSFSGKHGAIAENHVIVLFPPKGLRERELQAWADLLSSPEFNHLFRERSGTITVSVRLLLHLAFPRDWAPEIEAAGHRRSASAT